MVRADKGVSPSVDDRLQELGYKISEWSPNRNNFIKELKDVLATASKKQNGNIGIPDRIFIDTTEKLLIIVEEKPLLKDHDCEEIEKGAISGIKWYLSRFLNENLISNLKNFWDNWKILGIAVSGDIKQEYGHKFSCFCIENQNIRNLSQVTNFMSKEQFLAIFNNLNEEENISKIGASSKKINNLLRSIDSQKRPVLLSALMICLHTGKCSNDFPNYYKTCSADTLITNILPTALKILKAEGIPEEKLKVLETELAFLKTDTSLNSNNILKQILEELEKNVMPLFRGSFSTTSNYDIIGRFYEEFLKYAGVSNVKKGIVLTPRHITTLFTELIEIKDNDKIVDICCGTGAFLIAGMNAIINKINNSERSDKKEAIKKVKETQLLGFELNPTMYICAVSSMLFRGDGKSSIYNYDSINDNRAQRKLDEFQATIGFINPPYSGKENTEDPTPKEITFLTKMLDNCSRYGIIIAPLSMYFKDTNVRNNILKKHTLKAVINMPSDLFQPNASTSTAIALFETHRAFDYKNDEVLFYDLKDDGFVLAKNRGRTDFYNKWQEIKKQFLEEYRNPDKYIDNIHILKTKINKSDEWTIYAFSETDYSDLTTYSFISILKKYLVYQAKANKNLLEAKMDDVSIIEMLYSYYGNINWGVENKSLSKIDTTLWKEFLLTDIFDIIDNGKCNNASILPDGSDYNYLGAKKKDACFMRQVSANNDLVSDGKCIALICDGDGSVGYSNYIDNEKVVATVNLALAYTKCLNKYNAMFLVAVLDMERYKYSFGRKYKTRISTTKIKLPAIKTKNGNYEPDWKYMENYIKSLPYGDLL